MAAKSGTANTEAAFAAARRVMVDNQIRTFDVTDRALLSAFDTVPRERFVPADCRELAYLDRRIDLPAEGASRAMLPPLVLARLLQALAPVEGETALDVLSGTGYPAALLAAMGLKAVALESSAALTDSARVALAGTAVRSADAEPGLSATQGPGAGLGRFDVVLLNGAVSRVPEWIGAVLAEGGRLGLIREEGGVSRAIVYLKSGGTVGARVAFDAAAPVLPGFERMPEFVF